MPELKLRPEVALVEEEGPAELHDPPTGLELKLSSWQRQVVARLLEDVPVDEVVKQLTPAVGPEGAGEIEHFVRCLILLNLFEGAGDEARIKTLVARASGDGHAKRARMALLPDTLPPCGGCSQCCRPELRGFLTPAEAQRILQHKGFEGLAKEAGQSLIQTIPREGGDGQALGRREDGLCLFWHDEAGCRVALELGREALPAQCRVQPLEAVLATEGVIVSDGGAGPCGALPVPRPAPSEWVTPTINLALRQLAGAEGLHQPAMVLPQGVVTSITHLETVTSTAIGLLDLNVHPVEADLEAICRQVFLYADQLLAIPLEPGAGETCRQELPFWDPDDLYKPEMLPTDAALFEEALKEACIPFLARAHALCGLAYRDPAASHRRAELETCCRFLADVRETSRPRPAWGEDPEDLMRYHLRQRLQGRGLAAGGRVGPALGAIVLHYLVVAHGARVHAAGAAPTADDLRWSIRMARRGLDTVTDRETLERAGPALEVLARHFPG